MHLSFNIPSEMWTAAAATDISNWRAMLHAGRQACHKSKTTALQTRTSRRHYLLRQKRERERQREIERERGREGGREGRREG